MVTLDVRNRQHSVEQCLIVAAATHMPEYVGTANANRAWLAWKASEWTAAERYAHDSLEAWGRLPPDHGSLPFQWTCLLPLIAMATQAARLGDAIAFVRRLLDPLQQRLPDDMAIAGDQAVQAWERGDAEQVYQRLTLLIELAHTHHYL